MPRLTIRKYTINLQEQKNNNQQTSMSSSKNESSSQKSSKGESGDGNFWDNNGGAIMSATSSVLHAGYRTTRYVAKAGYKAGKNHYEQSKNKRNGEGKSGSSESLETVQSPPMGASQDVRQFQPPPLRAGQKQYQPGGVIVDAGDTPMANVSPVPATNTYSGTPQQGYPNAGYVQTNVSQPPAGGVQNFAPQAGTSSPQIFQPLYGADGQIIGYAPMPSQVGSAQPPAPAPTHPQTVNSFVQQENSNQQPQQYQQYQQYQQPQQTQQYQQPQQYQQTQEQIPQQQIPQPQIPQPQIPQTQIPQPQIPQPQIPQQQQYVHPAQRPPQPSPEQQQPAPLPARAQPAPPPTAPRLAVQIPGSNSAPLASGPALVAAQPLPYRAAAEFPPPNVQTQPFFPQLGENISTNPQTADEGELSSQSSNGPMYKVTPYEFMDPEQRAEAKRIELKKVDITTFAPPPTHAGRKTLTGPKLSQLIEDKQSGRITSEEFNSRSGSSSTGPVKKLGRSTTNSSWNSSQSSINLPEPNYPSKPTEYPVVAPHQSTPVSPNTSGIEQNVARLSLDESNSAAAVDSEAVPPPPYTVENSSKPLTPTSTNAAGTPGALNSQRTVRPSPSAAPPRNSTLSIKNQRTFSPNASSTNTEGQAVNKATVLKGNYDYQKPVNFAPPPRPHRNAQDLENEEANKNRVTANKYSRMAASSSRTSRASAPPQRSHRVLQNAEPEPIVNTPSNPSLSSPQANLPSRNDFPPPPKRVIQSSESEGNPHVAQTPLGISEEADMFPKISRLPSRPQFSTQGRSDNLSSISVPSNSPKAGPPIIKPKPEALKGQPPAKPFKPTYLTDRSESSLSSLNENAGGGNIDFVELAKNKTKKKAPPPKPKKKPTLSGVVSSMDQTNGTSGSKNDDYNPFSVYSKGSVPAELDHLQHKR